MDLAAQPSTTPVALKTIAERNDISLQFLEHIFASFIDNLELFSLLANVADVKSLVIHPATTTHSQCTEEELLDQGIKPNTIRLSIGTENIDDIIQDLDEAFKAIQ